MPSKEASPSADIGGDVATLDLDPLVHGRLPLIAPASSKKPEKVHYIAYTRRPAGKYQLTRQKGFETLFVRLPSL